MKIALIYDLCYPEFISGATRRIWELGRRLAARGHEVSLLSMKLWPGPAEVVSEGVRRVGVCRARPPFTTDGRRTFSEPVFFALGVLRHLRRSTFDIVDCAEMPYLAALAARAAVSRRTRLVVTWHEVRGLRGWCDYTGRIGGLVAAGLERVVGRLARSNIAISAMTAQRAVGMLGARDFEVVPCGVDLEAIRSVPLPPRESQILHVGRLVRHKQVEWALNAFAELDRARPGFTLKIIGTGYHKAALAALTQRLGLGNRVLFVDSVSEAELWREYARSQVLLFPSLQEGFGMVLIEAMALGTPAIALDAPNSAARTIMTSGVNGILVRTQEEMSAALVRLLSEPQEWQRLSDGARRTAERYDWSSIVGRLERFYEGLVTPGRQRAVVNGPP